MRVDRSLTWSHELIIKILTQTLLCHRLKTMKNTPKFEMPSVMINGIWFSPFPLVFNSSSFTIVSSLRDLLDTCNFFGHSSLQLTNYIFSCCRQDESHFNVPLAHCQNVSIVLYSLLDCATISFSIHTRQFITKPI